MPLAGSGISGPCMCFLGQQSQFCEQLIMTYRKTEARIPKCHALVGTGARFGSHQYILSVIALFGGRYRFHENRIFAELVSENGSKCKTSSHYPRPVTRHVEGRTSQVVENKAL
jgi:hypothetical protein